MRVWNVLLVLAACCAITLMARPAAAQLLVGAHAGGEFDNSEDWLVFGVDAWIPLNVAPVTVQPRFTYHPFEGGSIIQVDANVLLEPALANPGMFSPYIGVGPSIRRLTLDFEGADDETKLTFNFVTGARVNIEGSPIQPFVHTQYTFAKEMVNSYTLSFGVAIAI